MLIIEYDPITASPVRDGDAERWAEEIINLSNFKGYSHDYMHNDKNIELSYSTENIFYWIRVAVKENRLDREVVRFKFQNKLIKLDKNGHATFPKGFFDLTESALWRLF